MAEHAPPPMITYRVPETVEEVLAAEEAELRTGAVDPAAVLARQFSMQAWTTEEWVAYHFVCDRRRAGAPVPSEPVADVDPVPEQRGRIRTRKPVLRRNAWLDALNQATDGFEQRSGRTPSEGELWDVLSTLPPRGHQIAISARGDALEMPGAAPLRRANFRERFERLFLD